MQRSRASNPLIIAGMVFSCFFASVMLSVMQLGFVSGRLGPSRTVCVGRSDGASGSMCHIPKWQRGLDTAFFDHEASPMERFNGLNTYFMEEGHLGAFQKMMTAINVFHEKGSAGTQEALDVLFPTGLHLRTDVDLWLNLMEKTGPPRLIMELERIAAELDGEKVKPQEDIPEISELISKNILPDEHEPVGAERASDYASEIFRTLPRSEADETGYVVIYKHKEFEVRAYQPRQVAKTSIVERTTSVDGVFASPPPGEHTSVGEAFTSIVDWGQKQQEAIKVLMPIVTDYNKDEKSATGMSLSFEVLDNAKVLPDSRVSCLKANLQLVAVRKFLNVASDSEVSEQYDVLKKAVIADGAYDIVKDGSYTLMQYKPPHTMPWRPDRKSVV